MSSTTPGRLARIGAVAFMALGFSVAFFFPVDAQEPGKSASLERAARIEAAVKLCNLFGSIPKSSPKFDQIAARATAIYSMAALELKVPVPAAIALAEQRAATLSDELRNSNQVADFCRTMKEEEE